MKFIGRLWSLMWFNVFELSEMLGVGLGRFAPWVFEQMMGTKGSMEKTETVDEVTEGGN